MKGEYLLKPILIAFFMVTSISASTPILVDKTPDIKFHFEAYPYIFSSVSAMDWNTDKSATNVTYYADDIPYTGGTLFFTASLNSSHPAGTLSFYINDVFSESYSVPANGTTTYWFIVNNPVSTDYYDIHFN